MECGRTNACVGVGLFSEKLWTRRQLLSATMQAQTQPLRLFRRQEMPEVVSADDTGDFRIGLKDGLCLLIAFGLLPYFATAPSSMMVVLYTPFIQIPFGIIIKRSPLSFKYLSACSTAISAIRAHCCSAVPVISDNNKTQSFVRPAFSGAEGGLQNWIRRTL